MRKFDKAEVLNRPEFILTEMNYRHYTYEGRYPEDQFADDFGNVWVPITDRSQRKKLLVAKDFRHIDSLED